MGLVQKCLLLVLLLAVFGCTTTVQRPLPKGDFPNAVKTGTGPAIAQYPTGTGVVVGPAPVSGDATIAAGGSVNVLGLHFGASNPVALPAVAPTSGGVPYFSSGSAIASSAALSANNPVIGGGAGTAPSSGTRSGNTTAFATTSGTLTSQHCPKFDASGNIVDNGDCTGIITHTMSGTTPNVTCTTGASQDLYTFNTLGASNVTPNLQATCNAGQTILLWFVQGASGVTIGNVTASAGTIKYMTQGGNQLQIGAVSGNELLIQVKSFDGTNWKITGQGTVPAQPAANAQGGNNTAATIALGTDVAAASMARQTRQFCVSQQTALVANQHMGTFQTVRNEIIEKITLDPQSVTCAVSAVVKCFDCGPSAGTCTSGQTSTIVTTGSIATGAGGTSVDEGTPTTAPVAGGEFITCEVTSGTCATFETCISLTSRPDNQ